MLPTWLNDCEFILIHDVDAPLALSQERVWFLQMLDPQDRSYQFQSTLTLDGELDVAALRRTLDTLVERHEIFRTTFAAVDGTPVQRVVADARASLDIVDLGSQADPAALRRAIDAAIALRFDPAQLPLVRWTLIRVSAVRHVLVHIEHHLVHDGWSFYVVLAEMAKLYGAFVAGTPALLEPAPRFTDFARAQRAAAQQPQSADALAYWTRALAGAPALLNLPTDRARPPLMTHVGDAIVREFSAPTLRALERLSNDRRSTIFMTMFAAFAIVLQRYSGDTDICVGTGVAGRDTPDRERLVGMLVNNVVLRVDLSGDPTFEQLLERVRDVAIGAYAHQYVPLERVVEAVAPVRDRSFNPLFTTMFSFHDSPFPRLDFGALAVTLDQTVSNASAKMDLNVVAMPHAGGLTLKWEYNSDLFARDTMDRMVDHFANLIAEIVDEPERRISRYALASGRERTTLLDEFAHEARPYDRDCGIVALFERIVRRTPDARALLERGATISYAELDRRSNRLARLLQRNGVGIGTPVGLFLERSADAIVAMLAVLKTGALYVPLTTRFPAERRDWILADAGVALTITSADTQALLPAGVRSLQLAASAGAIAVEPDAPLDTVVPADALAYIMYTSGSTGTPKGVCVTQRGIVRLVAAGTPIAINADDVVANYAASAFDASTYEIWGALLNGATLAIVAPGMLSLDELGDALESLGVSVAFLTTPLFHQMVENRLDALTTLRLLVAGGDVMSPDHARRFIDSATACRLVNGYGPTENTTFTTLHAVTAESLQRRTIPLGRPIPNSSVYVLDAHGKPAGIDVPGEIYSGGDGVARGYCNRPELTAERFVADPFAADSRALAYRTGDVGRWRADGTLEFLGRADSQVKVRGFRIELGAIESTVRAHPAVRDAAVSVAVDTTGDKIVVAHVVPAPNALLDSAQIRAFLAERLPDYEVPSRVTILDVMPAGVGGKIDRARLAGTLEPQAKPLEPEPEPLRGAVEEKIGALWRQLLDVPEVTRTADFFHAGGHSLLAMRMLARLNDAFEIDLALHELFEHRTIAALAVAVERAPRRVATGPIGARPGTTASRPEPASSGRPVTPAPLTLSALADIRSLSDAEIDALLTGLSEADSPHR